MKRNLCLFSLSLVLAAQIPVAFASPQDTASSPAQDKFKQDIKAAVLNGSITIAQLKELQTNAETLKAYKSEQKPGAPVDFITPWQAVSKMKAIMATVKQPDRDTLEQDLQVMMANKQPTTPVSTEAPNPGAKLGKDTITATMQCKPTATKVKALQDRLKTLNKN